MAEQRRLNVFFDVDYTLIMADGRLRNHTEEVFVRLKEAGHGLYVWSGVGSGASTCASMASTITWTTTS